MEKILGSKTSLIYVFRNKETGEYVDENYDPTDNIFEAIGYADKELALKELEKFDEPEEWYLVSKVTSTCIFGEPIRKTEFI